MKKYRTFINQDEISHYLKDVRKEKILTPVREKELATMIKEWSYQRLKNQL